MAALGLDDIRQASRPEDLFGSLFGTTQECLALLESTYHDLEPAVDGDSTAKARLDELYAAAKQSLRRGYGRGPSFVKPLVLKGKRAWRVLETLEELESSTLLLVESEVGQAWAKLADDKRSPALARELEALKALTSPDAQERRHAGYVPEILDAFEHDGRMVAVLERVPDLYTLAEVRAAYPDGVPWLDAVWILRRLLVAVGYAHANGVLNLGLLPDNVLIEPEGHGLMLYDWTHALLASELANEKATMQKGFSEAWYPQEIRTGERARPQSDVYMAMRLFEHVLGGDAPSFLLPATVPERLKSWIRGCRVENPLTRPDDAWDLLREFDELVGERDFKPFVMPARSESTASEPSSGGPAADTNQQPKQDDKQRST